MVPMIHKSSNKLLHNLQPCWIGVTGAALWSAFTPPAFDLHLWVFFPTLDGAKIAVVRGVMQKVQQIRIFF